MELNWQAIIALLALGFSIWHGWEIRKHNKRSVRPHLTTELDIRTKKGYYKLELVNNGLGPAVIKEFLVKVDDKVIHGKGVEPIKEAVKIIFPSQKNEYRHGNIAKGYCIAAKEKVIILEIQFWEQPFPTPEVMEDAINKTSLDIDYQSFYKENFHFYFPTQN